MAAMAMEGGGGDGEDGKGGGSGGGDSSTTNDVIRHATHFCAIFLRRASQIKVDSFMKCRDEIVHRL